MTQVYFARRFCRSITSWTRRTIPLMALGTSLLLLSGLAGLGPSVQAQESSPESTTTSGRVYHTRFRLGPGEGIREVAIEGALRFSPDNTRIEWIGDGAYLRIITQEQGQKLRFEARADGQGHPTVGYKVDGRATPFDENAASYLADILPVVFRELGHDEIVDSLSILGHHINSDYELASVLYQRSDLYRERPGIRHAYLECLKKFQSDIERSRTTQYPHARESLPPNIG